jgi:hypothetical protein
MGGITAFYAGIKANIRCTIQNRESLICLDLNKRWGTAGPAVRTLAIREAAVRWASGPAASLASAPQSVLGEILRRPCGLDKLWTQLQHF